MTAAVKVVVKVAVGSAVVDLDLEVVDLEAAGSAAAGSAAADSAAADSAVVDLDLEVVDSAVVDSADSAVADSAVADSAVGAADSVAARTSACYTTNTWYCSDAKSSNLHSYCKRGRYSSSASNNSAIPTTNNTLCCSNYICICTVDASDNFVFACKYLRHNFCCSRSSCTNCCIRNSTPSDNDLFPYIRPIREMKHSGRRL